MMITHADTRGSGRWFQGVACCALVATLALGVLTSRVAALGASAMQHSDEAFARGDLAESLTFARRAALQYVPGGAHVEQAYSRLQAIAVSREQAGDVPQALRAWRAMDEAAGTTARFDAVMQAHQAQAKQEVVRLTDSSPRPRRLASDWGSTGHGEQGASASKPASALLASGVRSPSPRESSSAGEQALAALEQDGDRSTPQSIAMSVLGVGALGSLFLGLCGFARAKPRADRLLWALCGMLGAVSWASVVWL